MRLIDADKLTKKLVYRQWDIDDDIGATEDTIRVDEVGNCIDIVKKQKTVEAIPIEWIEQWAKERNKMGYTIDMCYTNDLIIDWRKENEDKNI